MEGLSHRLRTRKASAKLLLYLVRRSCCSWPWSWSLRGPQWTLECHQPVPIALSVHQSSVIVASSTKPVQNVVVSPAPVAHVMQRLVRRLRPEDVRGPLRPERSARRLNTPLMQRCQTSVVQGNVWVPPYDRHSNYLSRQNGNTLPSSIAPPSLYKPVSLIKNDRGRQLPA